MYVHIYIYTYIHIYIYVYIYIYIYVYTYMYIYIYIRMYIYIFIYMCADIRVCIHWVRKYTHICAHAYIYKDTHTYIHVHIYTWNTEVREFFPLCDWAIKYMTAPCHKQTNMSPTYLWMTEKPEEEFCGRWVRDCSGGTVSDGKIRTSAPITPTRRLPGDSAPLSVINTAVTRGRKEFHSRGGGGPVRNDQSPLKKKSKKKTRRRKSSGLRS